MLMVALTAHVVFATERPTCPLMIVGKAVSVRQVREDNVAGKGTLACLSRCSTLRAAGASWSADTCYCDSGPFLASDGDVDFMTCAVEVEQGVCQDNDAGLAAHYGLYDAACASKREECEADQSQRNMVRYYCPMTCGLCETATPTTTPAPVTPVCTGLQRTTCEATDYCLWMTTSRRETQCVMNRDVLCPVQYGDEIVIQNQVDGNRLLQRNRRPVLTNGYNDAARIDIKAAVWVLRDLDKHGSGCVFYGDNVLIENQYAGFLMLSRTNTGLTFTRDQSAIDSKAAVWKALNTSKTGAGCVFYSDDIVLENQSVEINGPRLLARRLGATLADGDASIANRQAVWLFLDTNRSMPTCPVVQASESSLSSNSAAWKEDSLFYSASLMDNAITNVVRSFSGQQQTPRVDIAEWTEKADGNGDGVLEYNELALALLQMDTDKNGKITPSERDEFLARRTISCGNTMVRSCQDCSGWANCRGDCQFTLARGCQEKHDAWLHCADEGHVCSCHTQIKYGNYHDLFTEPLPAHGNIMCNNATFHIAPQSANGIVKFCVCQEGSTFVEHRMDAYLESKGLFETDNLHHLLNALWPLFPRGARKVEANVQASLDGASFLQKLKSCPLYEVVSQEVFKAGDTDGDTRISRAEIDDMLYVTDSDDDEKLSLNEFKHYFGTHERTTEFWIALLGNSLGINTNVPTEELDMHDAPNTKGLLPLDDVTEALLAMLPAGIRVIGPEAHNERIITVAGKYAFVLRDIMDATKIITEGDLNGDKILEETEMVDLVELTDNNHDGIINHDEYGSVFGAQTHTSAFMEAIQQNLLAGSGEWTRFPNYCVSQEGINLEENNAAKGDTSVAVCKHVCDTVAYCVAIEWSDSGWNGARCKLVEGQELRGVRGADDEQWHDSLCYVRTGVRILKESLALANRGFARVWDLVDVLADIMPLTLREKTDEVVLAGSGPLVEHVNFVDMGPGKCLPVDHNAPRFIVLTKVTHDYCKNHCAYSTECEAYAYNSNLRLCHFYTPDLLESGSVRWGDAHCMVKKVLDEGDICRSKHGDVDRHLDCGDGLVCMDSRVSVMIPTMVRRGRTGRNTNSSTTEEYSSMLRKLVTSPSALDSVNLPMVCGVIEGANSMEQVRAKGENCGNRYGHPRFCVAGSTCLQTSTLPNGHQEICPDNSEQRDCRCIVLMNYRCGRSRGWSFPCENTADCLVEISESNSEIKMCPKNTLNCKCYGQLISRGARTIMRCPAWTLHMWVNYLVFDAANYNNWLTKVGFSDPITVALIRQHDVYFFLYRFYDRFKFDSFRDDSNYLSTLPAPNAAAIMYLAIGIDNYERLKKAYAEAQQSTSESSATYIPVPGLAPFYNRDPSHTPREGFVIIYGVNSREGVTTGFVHRFRAWAGIAYDIGVMHVQLSNHVHFILIRVGGNELTLFTSFSNTMTLRSNGALYYTTDKFVSDVVTPICESLRLLQPMNKTAFASAFHGAQYSNYTARIRGIVAFGVDRTRGQVSMENMSMLHNKRSVAPAQLKHWLSKMTPYLNLAGLEQEKR